MRRLIAPLAVLMVVPATREIGGLFIVLIFLARLLGSANIFIGGFIAGWFLAFRLFRCFLRLLRLLKWFVCIQIETISGVENKIWAFCVSFDKDFKLFAISFALRWFKAGRNGNHDAFGRF